MRILEHIGIELAVLGADLAIFGLIYKFYRNKSKNTEALKNAQYVELSHGLQEILQGEPNSALPYVVIRGTVQAISNPIKSKNISGVNGVIHEVILKEHKAQWNYLTRFWSDVEHELHRVITNTPFYITNASKFNGPNVEVLDPLLAKELPMITIYDQFTPNAEGLGNAVLSWIRGERSKGFQELESMVLDGAHLTGIGELAIVNGEVKLRPPSGQLDYYLTSLSREALVRKLEGHMHQYKILLTLFGCLGAYLFVYVAKVWYSRWSKKRQEDMDRKKFFEVRMKRRKELRDSTNSENDGSQMCIACTVNPIEVLLLECGHTCLCSDCVEHVKGVCPVCRAEIIDTVPAFLP